MTFFRSGQIRRVTLCPPPVTKESIEVEQGGRLRLNKAWQANSLLKVLANKARYFEDQLKQVDISYLATIPVSIQLSWRNLRLAVFQKKFMVFDC